jgi:polyhydroxyalkanoate synthesis regulator phasin
MPGREQRKVSPMQKALKNYLAIASGLTEVSKRAAKEAAKQLTKTSGATVEQVQTLAEDLLTTGLSNRESMVKLVRYEVDRALGLVGLATADEVEQLTSRIHELEQKLRAAEGRGGTATAAPPTAVKKVAKKVAVAKPEQLKAEAVQAAADIKSAADADQVKPRDMADSDTKTVQPVAFASPATATASAPVTSAAPKPAAAAKSAAGKSAAGKSAAGKSAAPKPAPPKSAPASAKATPAKSSAAKGAKAAKSAKSAPAKKSAKAAPAGAKLPARKSTAKSAPATAAPTSAKAAPTKVSAP